MGKAVSEYLNSPNFFNAYKRYSSHPNAAEQGIYLVLWFGSDEKVAGLVDHGIETPQQLEGKILEQLPSELRGKIDLFVLDLSRPNGAVKTVRKRRAAKKNRCSSKGAASGAPTN